MALSAGPTTVERTGFPTPWKVLEASRLSQVVSTPLLLSLELNQRLEMDRNNQGVEDL